MRVRVDPELQGSLVSRQLAWVGAQAAGTLLAVSALGAYPDVGFALALGLGAAVAFPRKLHKGLLVAGGVMAATLLAGIPGDGSSTLSMWATPGIAAGWAARSLAGAQILAGGAAAGLGLAWLSGPRDGQRFAQVALAGAATAGLGAWAAATLVPGTLHPALMHLVEGAIAGFVAAQVLVVGALRFRSVKRPPGPRRVKATLQEQYRAPCLRAHQLDAELAKRCPDEETRDGLGEIAAWVYGLQWTLQKIDIEVKDLDEASLLERIATLAEQAAAAEDAFTADRKLATVKHLEKLLQHVRGLGEERARNAALADYAGAYLEEARAGLALAHLQPGDHTPPGLDDVLGRLRAHGEERDARRRTAREMAAVVA
jgi:hypothetical protein